jgi:DDE superfamily endonuclease
MYRVQIVWHFDNHLHDAGPDEAVLIATVDGTHCRIYEQRKDPSPKWFSQKFNGPGLTYEIIIDVRRQQVLHINGPHEAGQNDIGVFRKPEGVSDRIPAGKKLIGDKGYRGEPDKISTPSPHDALDAAEYKKRARARHETFNKRIKSFGMLKQTFRSDIAYHRMAFEAVCVLVQYDIETDHPLFAV